VSGLLVNSGAQFSNIQSQLGNSGTIRNQNGGSFFNFTGSTIQGFGMFDNTAATVSNLAVFTMGRLNNAQGASFLNFGGATLTITNQFTNQGSRIDNLANGLVTSGNGEIRNFDGGTINNSGRFEVTGLSGSVSNEAGGTLNNSGQLTSRGFIFNQGAFNNNFGGSFENQNVFNNLAGVLNNNAGAAILN